MITHEWISTAGGTFNLTPDGPDESVWLTTGGIEGMGMPEVDSFTRSTALLDGQTYAGWRAQPRDVFWPLALYGRAMSEGAFLNFSADFWSTLRPGRSGVWRVTTVHGARELTCRFVSDGGARSFIDPTLRKLEVHALSLVADDPWWRGPEVSATFQTPQDSLPFFATTPDRVFNIQSANSTGETSITNPGDVAAWPVFRIDGPASSFRVSSSSMTVAGAIPVAVGEYLIVDTNPTKQYARLYSSDGGWMDVTAQLTEVQFGAIPSYPSTIDVVLNGAGSLTISIIPGYFRAF